MELALRQLCWSHLLRDFQGFVDSGGDGAAIGEALLKQARRIFKWWHRVRDGTMPRRTFKDLMREVAHEVGRLLGNSEVCPDKKTAGMAREPS